MECWLQHKKLDYDTWVINFIFSLVKVIGLQPLKDPTRIYSMTSGFT